MKQVLYMGWIGYNNLGDDLLWNLFNQLGSQYLDEKEIKIVPSCPGIDINKLDHYDTVVLGGGSLLVPRYIRILYKALNMGKKIIIWGSGMDRIDIMGLDNIITGKLPSIKNKFNQEEAKMLKAVFSRASFAGVRGPFTKKALEALGVNSKDIQVIGDPGLLLLPPRSPVKRKNKEKVIALNWGTTYNNLYGDNESKVEDKLVLTCKSLIKHGYKVLIFSVWDKDRNACKRLYDNINDPINVTLDEKLYTESELITLLSSCQLTINFKLHSNVLSLAANVPIIGLGYRFKVFDFAYSLGLENYVISTASLNLEEEVLERVRLIEQNRDTILSNYHEKQKMFQPFIVKPFQENLYIQIK